jgi:methionyl-tRNA formyltransferase
MKKISEPIVFFGSGPVAAEALELLQTSFEIEAVVTKPKPEHHKGAFPVLSVAERYNLPVLTARTKNELNTLFSTAKLQSRLAVLIDYGIIVSQEIIDYFPLGIVNSHFSILPEWRGADPITFAILSGQKQTGVSLMMLVAAMDEGPLLAYGEYEMPGDITTPQLTDYLIKLSHALLEAELPRYMAGEAKAVPQSITKRDVSYSRKLTKQDGILDFTKPAARLEREIRAFIEWPKSRTTIADKDVIITGAHVVPTNSMDGKPGNIQVVKEANTLMIETSDGMLCVDRLKPAGKAEMSVRQFLAGYGNQI